MNQGAKGLVRVSYKTHTMLFIYSYSQGVLDTTIRKETQITYVRRHPSYKQLKDEPKTVFMWKS